MCQSPNKKNSQTEYGIPKPIWGSCNPQTDLGIMQSPNQFGDPLFGLGIGSVTNQNWFGDCSNSGKRALVPKLERHSNWGSPFWFGDPIFGLGRDAFSFPNRGSHKRYGSFSNSVTNICLYTKCFYTLVCCGWAYGSTLRLIYLWRWAFYSS